MKLRSGHLDTVLSSTIRYLANRAEGNRVLGSSIETEETWDPWSVPHQWRVFSALFDQDSCQGRRDACIEQTMQTSQTLPLMALSSTQMQVQAGWLRANSDVQAADVEMLVHRQKEKRVEAKGDSIVPINRLMQDDSTGHSRIFSKIRRHMQQTGIRMNILRKIGLC